MVEERDLPETPRVEPEITPPDYRRHSPWPRHRFPHEFADTGWTHRIYVTRLGSFAGALLLLALVVLAVVFLLAFVGALLIWIPIVALIVVVAALSGFLGLRRR